VGVRVGETLDGKPLAAMAAAGVVALVLVCDIAGLTAYDARNDAEHQRHALGDAEHPPMIDIVSLPNFTRFIIKNPSDYPSYGVSASLFEVSQTPNRFTYSFGYAALKPHTGRLNDNPWFFDDRWASSFRG